MIVDLSHKLEPGMPSYPGLPAPRFHVFLAHGDAGQHTHYAPGTSFQIASYELGGNTGTYLDAPFHRYPHGSDLAGVPLEKLVDLRGVIIAAPEDGPIEPAVASGFAVRGKAVLMHTGWASHWAPATTSVPVRFSQRPPAIISCMPARCWSESTARTSTT